MFIDELYMLITFQKDREIIEPGDHTLQLDPIDQKDGHGGMRLADIVQK